MGMSFGVGATMPKPPDLEPKSPFFSSAVAIRALSLRLPNKHSTSAALLSPGSRPAAW